VKRRVEEPGVLIVLSHDRGKSQMHEVVAMARKLGVAPNALWSRIVASSRDAQISFEQALSVVDALIELLENRG
jgi:CHASE3 domain sensor protein